MTKMLTPFCVACLIYLASSAALADFYDGYKLIMLMREHEKAESSDPGTDYVNASRYSGYVTGVADTLNGIAVCLGHDTTVRQVTAIVTEYMNAHPEEWTHPAAILVSKALQQAFPCGGKSRG